MDRVLSIALMAAGYILLVVEMIIPGFGLPGILGIALSVFGLIAFGPTLSQALIIAAIFAVLLAAALVICLHTAAKGRFSKSRFVLHAVDTHSDAPAEAAVPVGTVGTAVTPLRPAGIAAFDGKRTDVTTEGDFIAAGEQVRVLRAEGKRITVCKNK